MQRRARYRLGPVYEIINNRVSPVAIIFMSTLLRRYTVSPGYTLSFSLSLSVTPFRFIYVAYVTSTVLCRENFPIG